jgi:hypothetical protein
MTRHLTLLSATALWAVLAYLLVAGYMFSRTAPHATWSGPKLWPVALVVAAILAHAAWGYLAGHLFASRFTAPLVAIGAFGVQQFVGTRTAHFPGGGQSPTWMSYLAAHNQSALLAPWQALFYAGLTITGVAALTLLLKRDVIRLILCGGSLVIVIGGIAMVWGEMPRHNPTTGAVTNGWGHTVHGFGQLSPEPVCRGDTVIVCAHPQFQPWLDDAVLEAETLVEPLAGLPAMPVPIQCRNTGFASGRNSGSSIDISGCVDQFVAEDSTLSAYGQIQNEAQMAISVWLLNRIGGRTMCDFPMIEGNARPPGLPTAAACDTADRFATLSDSEQHAWLMTHYANLRAGDLTLADLP